MSIEEFPTPFQLKLDKENRWVKPESSLPWDAMTRQIILISEGKHEAARTDLDDNRNDVNTNRIDKEGNVSGTGTNLVKGDVPARKNDVEEIPKANK